MVKLRAAVRQREGLRAEEQPVKEPPADVDLMCDEVLDPEEILALQQEEEEDTPLSPLPPISPAAPCDGEAVDVWQIMYQELKAMREEDYFDCYEYLD